MGLAYKPLPQHFKITSPPKIMKKEDFMRAAIKDEKKNRHYFGAMIIYFQSFANSLAGEVKSKFILTRHCSVQNSITFQLH